MKRTYDIGECPLLLLALLLAPAVGRGDGAFPDSLGIMLPADRAETVVVAANFGVLVSHDDGATWRYVCEVVIGPYAAPYQLGPPPDDRLFAVHWDGLSYSNDLACSWQSAAGPFTSPTDVFADPTDASRVFAIGSGVVEGVGAVSALFVSADGGLTFGDPILWAEPGAFLTGIEVARSAPSTLVAALYDAPVQAAALLTSHDDGGTFDTVDLSASLGPAIARIAAIDRDNPDRVFLRVQDGTLADKLAIAEDGGATLAVPLVLEGLMTSFLQLSDGALVVGTANEPGAYLSTDGGETFAAWPNAPHLRAIGERDGTLYAVADNFADGFAVARSTDGGDTWEPLLRYVEIAGVLGCGELPSACAADWIRLKELFGIDDRDAGPAPDAGPADTNQPRGGGCSVGGPSPFIPLWIVFGLAIARRSHPRSP